MPKKISKKQKQHGKTGNIKALLITLFLSAPGTLLPVVGQGEKALSQTHPLVSVTVNNVQNNVTIINQSFVW